MLLVVIVKSLNEKPFVSWSSWGQFYQMQKKPTHAHTQVTQYAERTPLKYCQYNRKIDFLQNRWTCFFLYYLNHFITYSFACDSWPCVPSASSPSSYLFSWSKSIHEVIHEIKSRDGLILSPIANFSFQENEETVCWIKFCPLISSHEMSVHFDSKESL